ncbi:MAG: hypothetical protein LRY71_07300 [Bacillaceae bacterium]|nr:hypothetical protein [Bacillaceae bacterium]
MKTRILENFSLRIRLLLLFFMLVLVTTNAVGITSYLKAKVRLNHLLNRD